MRKIFPILAILLLPLLLVVPVFAQEGPPATTTTLPQNETVEGDYFAANDVINVSGTVSGDAYIAGGSITVDGSIGNDLIVGGGNVLITGEIAEDVRVAGGNITLSGATVGGSITVIGGSVLIDNATSVGRTIVAAGGNLQLLAPITGGVTVAGGNVVIGNTVGGDVTAGVGELTLTNEAKIAGNLTYWSDREANIASAGAITGETTRQLPPDTSDDVDEDAAAAGIAGFIFAMRFADMVFLLITGLIVLSLFPIYSDRISKTVFSRFGMSLLIGLLAMIITPIISIILMLTLFGIPFGIFLLILYLAALWFVRIFAISMVGQYILNRTNKKRDPRWGFVVGLVIYFVLGLLPIISMLADLIAVLAGLGAWLIQKRAYYGELRSKKLV